MRWLVALVAVAVLGGCVTPEPEAADAPTDEGSPGGSGNQTASFAPPPAATQNNTSPADTNATASNSTAASGNATGNAAGNATGNQTSNETAAPAVLVFETTFGGSLPVDGATATHPFSVPAGASRVEVTYTSEHVGLFTALATLNDPAGERLSSSDACGFGSTGAETDVCEMLVDEEVGPGEWSMEITWQVGQATEDYTFHVRVFGTPA